MEPVILIGISMIWIVVIILSLMIAFGHDVKSRGFADSNSAVAALPMNGIGFKAYFSRRKEHPVTNEPEAKKYKIWVYVSAILAVALVIYIIRSLMTL